MAISVVNGYLCMNGCDAAKARTGQNPHPSTNSQSGSDSSSQANSVNGNSTNAVIYGGALAGLNSAAPTNSHNPAPPSRVDISA
jgi:hypothetical protein